MPNKVNYQEYMASREWGKLVHTVRQRANGECERCYLGPHKHTHHLTYERLGAERLEDLVGVCDACHEYLHGRSDFDPANLAHHIAHAERMGRGSIHEPYQEFLRLSEIPSPKEPF